MTFDEAVAELLAEYRAARRELHTAYGHWKQGMPFDWRGWNKPARQADVVRLWQDLGSALWSDFFLKREALRDRAGIEVPRYTTMSDSDPTPIDHPYWKQFIEPRTREAANLQRLVTTNRAPRLADEGRFRLDGER